MEPDLIKTVFSEFILNKTENSVFSIYFTILQKQMAPE
jgi:hypothetical protein